MEKDLIPQFALNRDARRKNALLIDSDTDTGWSAAGVAVDGPDKQHHGHKLAPVEVQEDVNWSPASFWCRDLKLFNLATPATSEPGLDSHRAQGAPSGGGLEDRKPATEQGDQGYAPRHPPARRPRPRQDQHQTPNH